MIIKKLVVVMLVWVGRMICILWNISCHSLLKIQKVKSNGWKQDFTISVEDQEKETTKEIMYYKE